MRYIILTSLFIGSVLSIFAIDIVSAEIVVVPPNSTTALPEVSETPGIAIASIINYFILLTSVLAVMAITWGGLGFILSTGDDEKMKKARKTVIYAFVGLVVAGLAYSIVELLTRSQF